MYAPATEYSATMMASPTVENTNFVAFLQQVKIAFRRAIWSPSVGGDDTAGDGELLVGFKLTGSMCCCVNSTMTVTFGV